MSTERLWLTCAGKSGTGADAFLNGEELSIAHYLVGVAAITYMLVVISLHHPDFRNRSFALALSGVLHYLSICLLPHSQTGLNVVGFAIRLRIVCVSLFAGSEES